MPYVTVDYAESVPETYRGILVYDEQEDEERRMYRMTRIFSGDFAKGGS